MRYGMRGFIVAAAAIVLAGLAAPALAQSATSGPPGWRAAKLPVSVLSSLFAAAAANANDVWAAGGAYNPNGQAQELIIHWNGKSWSRATTTGIPSDISISSAAVPSSTTAWFSGSIGIPGPGVPTAIYRLSGSKWLSVPLPAGMPGASITSGSAGQVWAFGPAGSAVARWTGKAWQVYSTGLSATTTAIHSLSFSASNSGWAVGNTQKPTKPLPQPLLPLVLHWNGTAWSKAAAPALPAGATTGELESVLATKSAGVWATGTYETGGSNKPWLVHWNGSSWKTIPVPAGFEAGNSLGNISVGESGQPQWISGDTGGDTSGYLYYSGGVWTFVRGLTTPNESGYLPQLVSIPGSNMTWAVGTVSGDGPSLAPTARIEYAP